MKRENNLERFEEAFYEVLEETGAEAARVSEISEKVGVNARSIYRWIKEQEHFSHFSVKDGFIKLRGIREG